MKTFRRWAIVLSSNLIGTMIFAAILPIHGVFPDEVVEPLGKLAQLPLSDRRDLARDDRQSRGNFARD